MVTTETWDRFIIRKPFEQKPQKNLTKIIGIDSESYTTGEPFMFCTSLGEELSRDQFPQIYFTPEYINANFMVYNLKFDSGAFLYFLPREVLYTLWFKGDVVHDGYAYRYIPHKMLRISRGRDKVVFWDISQFFHMSLDKASQTYINARKLDMRTKRFTPAYVSRYHKSIRKYCIQDAVLTQRLGQYLQDKLQSFGIPTPSLYSCASIAYKYFSDRAPVVDSYQIYKDDERALQLACDSYQGGKFEVTARGSLYGYEYDITSAYPCEIRELHDLRKAKVLWSKKPIPEASYGAIRCRIKNPDGLHLPCSVDLDNTRVYPAGEFYRTITKQEYEYLQELGIEVEIYEAVWWIPHQRRRIYKKVIDELFKLKAQNKNKDKMLYNVSKIVMNSYYGKMAQVIERWDGVLTSGPAFNPIYASTITANTRIKICKMQNLLGPKCVAVHTDSVITTEPLPKELTPATLGQFGFEVEGNAIVIACGLYQLGDKNAYKGLEVPRHVTWSDLLQKYRYKTILPYKQLRVESWVESMAKGHDGLINVFNMMTKEMDLNGDSKRLWPSRMRGIDFTTTLQQSLPRIHVETEPPKYWRKM